MRPLDPRLLRHASAARRFVLVAAALAVATAGLLLVQAELVASVIADAFLGGATLDAVGPALLAVLGLVAGRALLAWAGEVAAHRAAADVIRQLRTQLVAHVLRLGPRDPRLPSTGELATLATRGLDGLDGYFGRYLPTLLVAAVVPAAVGGRILSADWLSGVIIGITVPLIPIFMILIGLHTERATSRQWRALAVLGHHFLDLVAGLDALVAFGRARRQSARLRELADAYRRATLRTLRVAFLSALALELLATLSVALVAVSVGLRLVEGRLDLATALLVLVLAPEVYLPLRAVGARFHDSATGLAAATEVFAVLELPAHDATGRNRFAAPDPARAALRLCDVVVEGRGGPVLDRLTATVAPGELVGVCGPSGAGKSTLLDLLLGLRRPDAGRITVGDTDLADVDRDSWLRRVAWVPQRPALVAGTVAENIALGDPDAGPERIRAAAAAAALDVHPDTLLGENGAGLSTGQRRRVALARAVLADRPLLLLDEPTEGVDAATAEELLAALPRITAGRTTLLVSHRPEVLARCDRVLAVAAGVAGAAVPAAHVAGAATPAADVDSAAMPAAGVHGEAMPAAGVAGAALPAADVADAALPAADIASEAMPAAGVHGEAMPAAGVAGAALRAPVDHGGPSRVAAALRPRPVPGGRAAPEGNPQPGPSPSTPVRAGVGGGLRADALLGSRGPSSGGPDPGGPDSGGPGWGLAAVRAERARLTLAVLLGAAALGCGVALTATSAWLISAAALHPPVLTLMVAIVAVRAFGLGRGVFRYAERLVAHDAALRAATALRVRVWAALVRVGPAVTGRLRRGELLSRLVADVEAQQDLLVRVLMPVASALLVGAAAAVGVGLALPAAGLVVALGFGVAALLAPALTAWAAFRSERRSAAARGEVVGHTVELLAAAPDLICFGAARRHRLRLRAADELLGGLLGRAAVARGAGAGLGVLAIGVTSVAATAVGVDALRAGVLAGPALAVLALTPLTLADVVAALPEAAIRLLTARPAAQRLAALEAAPVTVPDPVPVPSRPAPVPVSLAARDLAVRWPGATSDAVRGVDLDLGARTRVALVGPSGSGKSTVVAALLRTLAPSAGRLLADGRDVAALPADTVRAAVAWCGADTHLFDNTLRANLTLARPDATDEELVVALRRARLGRWWESLPEGLDTPIGHHGGAVSGGERQRIGVARALLADRPIMVFDEPTAHLDAATADELAAEIMASTTGKAALLVTHHPDQTPELPQLRLGHSREPVAVPTAAPGTNGTVATGSRRQPRVETAARVAAVR